jgi:hypothetical protein
VNAFMIVQDDYFVKCFSRKLVKSFVAFVFSRRNLSVRISNQTATKIGNPIVEIKGCSCSNVTASPPAGTFHAPEGIFQGAVGSVSRL